MFRRSPRARALRRVGAAAVAGLVLLGCQSSHPTVAPTTVAPTTVVPTTSTHPAGTSAPPTTASFQPSGPQKSQDLAGSHLIAAWMAGDRAAASTDAAPAAVDAVFAQPFPAGGVQARGCSAPVAGPATCTYRVLANGNLLSLSVVANSSGWFTLAARFQS